MIDSRYRSGRPLMEKLQHPEDTAHARIYDRLLSMCCPVCFTGENFRNGVAQEKIERLKEMLEKPNK